MKTIQEVFKQFCKERHEEDKGKNFDLLQSVYASTEFFDTTLYKFTGIPLTTYYNPVHCAEFPLTDYNLPFQNIFSKIDDNIYLFIREYSPMVITGAICYTDWKIENVRINQLADKILTIPFSIMIKDTEDKGIVACKIPVSSPIIKRMIDVAFPQIVGAYMTLCELSKKSVAVDKPKNPNQYEYYRRKRATTIKVPQRPIYYILGEKNEDVTPKYKSIRAIGNLEYTYAFKVRGHWRKIDDKHYGKDRNGNYNVAGYTWVNEYTKGEGELAKRIRVIE